jgi:DNA-binding NarL/FixJ family response regulator
MAIVVAVAGAGDIVTEGLWHILGQAPDLEIMRDYSMRFPHVGVLPDVVLYDAVGIQDDDGAEMQELVDSHEAAVVVVGRDLRPGLATRAIARGAAGCVSIEAPASEILATIREAAGGELNPGTPAPALGGEALLSDRQVTILGDIVKGYANTDIARRQSLTINTIKSYVRTTYRKIGVTNRAQAVSWALQHGFEPQDHDEPTPGMHASEADAD